MGRWIYGDNVDFEYKYWFAEQNSELGLVLQTIEGVTCWRYIGDDGEYTHVSNDEETRKAIKKAIKTPEKYATQDNAEPTKAMLKAVLKCLEENKDIDTVKFFSEY